VDDDEHDLACQLADHVGCLPLAMATIGGYVKQSQVSLAEFFENIKHKATLWEKAPKVQEVQAYERSLITVFKKAFEDLTPPARELLNILAFLDPDSVPEEIFDQAIKNKRFNLINSKNDLIACYFELRSRQLIRRDTSGKTSYVSMHRVVQWNVLLDLSADYNKRWGCFQEAFDIVKAMLPKTDPKAVPEPEIWPPYAKHGRQILELRTHCLWPEPPVELPMDFARILAEMGTYMWFSGKFPEGEKALGTAENILDDNKAKWNDELRAHVYAMLGIITSFEGVSERKRSMEFRKNAYFSRNQGIGRKPESDRTRDEDIMVWNMHSDMAFGYIQEEDWESTAKNMDECFEQYQKWDKNEMAIPYEYAKYYQLMSFCHMAEQKPVEAIKAISRCLELMEEAAGKAHPMSQLIKFCHACLLWHTQGAEVRYKALEINKAVLEHRRDLLGEFSHFTLESYSTCGKLCYDAGEVDLARQYLESCLQRRKRAVWNEEGITRAQFRYANVLRTLAKQAQQSGDEEKAKAYAEDAKKRAAEVTRIVQRYRKEYEKYMPVSEDEESNLDQMVSIWAGRFSGGLRQLEPDLSFLPDDGPDIPPTKKRRLE
jgi:tetratricopeptide (TPR) repeat protein